LEYYSIYRRKTMMIFGEAVTKANAKRIITKYKTEIAMDY
jgi:hypothetical protein